MIEDRRNFVVGADHKKFRTALLTFVDVDPMVGIFESGFFQHDGELLSVGCCGGVEIDHFYIVVLIQTLDGLVYS